MRPAFWPPGKGDASGPRLAALLALSLVLPGGVLRADPAGEGARRLAYRGYYFILSRNPSYGPAEYRLILDRMAEDGANTWILWIGGGFPSKRYPETWDYNRGHANCRKDFVGEVIEEAHRRSIRVLLGFTPFAYDGVNRYGAAHPELGAVDGDGKPAVTGGIHSLGRGLCPSRPASREFMMGYARELLWDFYPQADGVFLEHSDYGACSCKECAGGKGLEKEWGFVKELAARLFERRSDALVMVYPQYATLGVEYDPRLLVFIAPHNRRGEDRVRNPRVLWRGYWEVGGLFRDLCRQAAREGYSGVIPSMENHEYANAFAFDCRWGPPGVAGWDDLLVRVTRLSFRVQSLEPESGDGDFRRALEASVFGGSAPAGAADDLLALHALLDRWEGWSFRGGPMRLPEGPVRPEALDPAARVAFERDVVAPLKELRGILRRSESAAAREPDGPGKRACSGMAQISGWVLRQWEGKLPPGALE